MTTNNNNTELTATFTSTEINILSQLINGAFSSDKSREAAIEFIANRLEQSKPVFNKLVPFEPTVIKLVEYSLSECPSCDYYGNIAEIDVEEWQNDWVETFCSDCNFKYVALLEDTI